jgi:hypothetical protein
MVVTEDYFKGEAFSPDESMKCWRDDDVKTIESHNRYSSTL